MKPKTKKFIFSGALLFCILIIAGLLTGLWVNRWLHTQLPVADAQTIYSVKPGQSLSSVSRDLHKLGLLEFPGLWRIYARIFQPEPIKAGEYQFAAKESPLSILNLLQSGQVVSYSVTLVEGKTFKDFVAILAKQNKLTPALAGLTQDEQVKLLAIDETNPEGWFFPDTYHYHAGDTDVDILRRAHKKMRAVLQTAWQDRQEGLPYNTPYEALIMASIVEKETGAEFERAEIAGVFVRRLERAMRLQTDPTVIYGLGDQYQGNLKRKHLRQNTPYNTYVIKGLPPTPIAMPGGEAIRAALNPASGDTLYFVAKGDGTHYFSKSLEEHNQAVARFQRRRVQGYRSAPPTK